MYPGSGIGRKGLRLHQPLGASRNACKTAVDQSLGRTSTATADDVQPNYFPNYFFDSFQAPPSARGSFGSPSTSSPMMLRWICDVPA